MLVETQGLRLGRRSEAIENLVSVAVLSIEQFSWLLTKTALLQNHSWFGAVPFCALLYGL
ncbi:hypothetical protein [Paenibacillus odorifer]|uniref:Uncharacterized protein n=1 Tax=Paenibacillus odorifer TaxID=189426 RepID=A0AAD0KL53_9BACL|nr:hypothetical protein [Paenibacillus odorifer]AWV35210.1 hypothetical protein CD191_22660 [Paenibacillus odorifer]